jgi:hypothetical protein
MMMEGLGPNLESMSWNDPSITVQMIKDILACQKGLTKKPEDNKNGDKW